MRRRHRWTAFVRAALAIIFFTAIATPASAQALDLPLASAYNAILGEFQLILSATGGTAPYHYTLSPGATPIPGMRVQDGAPLPLGFPVGSGGFIGVLNTDGIFPTSIRVTDSMGAFFDRAFTVTVHGMFIVSANPLPKANLGSAFSFTMNAYGGIGPHSWTATGLPPGLSIATSGLISGTPTTAGTYSPAFTLTDLGTGRTRVTTYTLTVNPFAIDTPGLLPDATVGVPYSQPIHASNCLTCMWSSTGFPGGLTFSGGIVSGTPISSATTTSVTVTAAGTNGTTSKVFGINVLSNPMQQLSAGVSQSIQTTVGTASTFAQVASGGTPPYSWSLQSGTLPPGIELDGPGDSLGASLVPGVSYLVGRVAEEGSYSFVLKVTDAHAVTAIRNVTWNVTRLALGYTSLPITGTTLTYGVAYSQRLLGMGGTGVYTWTHTGGTMPPGLTLNSTTGVISGTPTNTGFFSVPLQLTDSSGSVITSTLFFTIASPSGALISVNVPDFTLNLGTTLTIPVSATGGTGPYTITALNALPPGFSLLSGSSSNFPDGSMQLAGVAIAAGTFRFRLQATDALGNIGVRTITFTVTPLFVYTTAVQPAKVGRTYSQRLLAAGGTGAITWSVSPTTPLPPGLTLNSAGRIVGTPTQTGVFSFTVVATDASGTTATRSLSMTISSVLITSPEILPPVTAGEPYSFSFSASGAVGAIAWSATGVPGGMTLSPSGLLSGTLSVFTSGSFTLQVTATDGTGVTSNRFVLPVAAPNPSVVSFSSSTTFGDLVVGQITALTLSTFGGIPPYTWAVVSGSALPPGLRLVAGDRLVPTATPGTTWLTGAPTAAGDYVFDLVATDAEGTQMVRTFTLHVTTIAVVSQFPTTARAGEPYVFQFTATGGTAPYTYSMSASTTTQPMLPPGLTLSAGGLLSGTPTSTGFYSFRLLVTDGTGKTISRFSSIGVYDFINGGSAALAITASVAPDTSVGTGRSQSLSVSSSSGTAPSVTWSLVGGALPPGMSLLGSSIQGTPAVEGNYVYRLRATNAANAAQFAEREYALNVTPMQIVSPAYELNWFELPAAEAGTPYSTRIRVAGGTRPYTFSPQAFGPLPAGLTLSADGVLSGTPTQIGVYGIAFNVADSAGHTFASLLIQLTVTPPGKPRPLSIGSTSLGTVSKDDDFTGKTQSVLDYLVRGGVKPFSFSLSPGSNPLPPGMSILPGGNGVPSVLGGAPTTTGSYSFSFDVEDAAGQMLTIPLTLFVVDLAVLPQTLPPGVVGTPYSVALTPHGTPPYGSFLKTTTADLPPGLTLSAGGVLSGTPTSPGNFLLSFTVNDGVTSLFSSYRMTIDNAAGHAKGVSLSPASLSVHTRQGAPNAPIPVTVNLTAGTSGFTALISGIPGATVSAMSVTAPATINVNLGPMATAGTFHGFVGVSVPGAANLYDMIPITVEVDPPPVIDAISITPNSGSGIAQTFTLTYSDSAGVETDLTGAQLRFTNTAAGTTCVVHYRATTGLVRMQDDVGGWSPFVPFGSGTLANSRCTLNLASSSAAASGNDLMLALNLAFAGPFAGPATIAMRAISASGPNTGWVNRGTFTVGAVLDATSVTPNSGTGMTQMFTATFSDSLGVAADLRVAQMRVGATNTGACVVQYNAMTDQVRMLDDAGTPGVFKSFGPGQGSINNSQCTLNLESSSAARAGNDLTLNLGLAFSASFIGVRPVSLRANSNFGTTTTGWVVRGTYTVGVVLSATSITPSSGSGASQSFSLAFSDSEGVATDLRVARVRFAGATGPQCTFDYNAMTNLVRILNDDGTWGPFTPFGSAGSLSNSQCSLFLPTSIATRSATDLTLVLNISFVSPAFSGVKTISMRANSNLGPTTGWVNRGTWTVP